MNLAKKPCKELLHYGRDSTERGFQHSLRSWNLNSPSPRRTIAGAGITGAECLPDCNKYLVTIAKLNVRHRTKCWPPVIQCFLTTIDIVQLSPSKGASLLAS